MRRAKTKTAARAVAMTAPLLAASLLAACSSSTTTGTTPAAASPADSNSAPALTSPAAADSPTSTPAAPTTFAFTGTAADSQGDAATVSVSIGEPVPQLTLNQAALNACDSIDDISDGADQTMAIPIQVTATLTSSIETNVGVIIDGTNVVASGGNFNSNPNLEEPWVTNDSDSACSNSGIDGELEWDNVAPGQSVTWSGWELDPDVITPDDTSGSAVDQVIFLEPQVVFTSTIAADIDADAAHSQNLVYCTSAVTSGVPVIAADPSAALADGCTADNGS